MKTKHHRMGKPPIYPWQKWTNGRIHLIRQGVDFRSTVKGMQQNIYAHARRNAMSAQTEIIDDQTIAFQFRTNE